MLLAHHDPESVNNIIFVIVTITVMFTGWGTV